MSLPPLPLATAKVRGKNRFQAKFPSPGGMRGRRGARAAAKENAKGGRTEGAADRKRGRGAKDSAARH
jgi:hypothetical protein